MALGVEVGLIGAGHIVLDGDPAPLPKKGQSPPIFGPFLLWPNSWMHQNATWYGVRPQPRGLCVRLGPSPLNFRPMLIMAALRIADADIIFLACGFFYLFYFLS